MPHDPWDVTGSTYESNFVTFYDNSTCTTAATNCITYTAHMTNCTSANVWDPWSRGVRYQRNSASMWYDEGYNSYAPPGRQWEPVQAAEFRKDWDDFKNSFKRRRAEAKARRLFHHVIGDVAYFKYRKNKYHEFVGAGGTRYRIRPAMRVQVMNGKKGDEVDYELCAHLDHGIPWHDSMAVQHLMLSCKDTEQKFIDSANQHPAHGPYPIEELTRVA